jgi:hypothetical protein
MKEAAMSTATKENTKVYIEGVRKVSWDTGEMCEFASDQGYREEAISHFEDLLVQCG